MMNGANISSVKASSSTGMNCFDNAAMAIVFQTGCSPSAVSGYTNFRATTNITYKIMTSYLAVMQCGTI